MNNLDLNLLQNLIKITMGKGIFIALYDLFVENSNQIQN